MTEAAYALGLVVAFCMGVSIGVLYERARRGTRRL